jgi:hypothetical protein
LAGGGDGGCALRRAVDGGGRNDVGPLWKKNEIDINSAGPNASDFNETKLMT